MLAFLIAIIAHDSHHSHHRVVGVEASMADGGQRRLRHRGRFARNLRGRLKIYSIMLDGKAVSIFLCVVRTFHSLRELCLFATWLA